MELKEILAISVGSPTGCFAVSVISLRSRLGA